MSLPAGHRPVGGVAEQARHALAAVDAVEHPAAVPRRPADGGVAGARSGSRSPRRSSRCRCTRRRRRPATRLPPISSSVSPAKLDDVGQPEVDALGDADREHLRHARPAARASARPATSPACVPPLDDVCTIAAGSKPLLAALVHQLAERRPRSRPRRPESTRRSGSRTAPHRRPAAPPSSDSRAISNSPHALSAGAREVQLRPEHRRQQLVADRGRRAARPTARGGPPARARHRRRPSCGSGSTAPRRPSRASVHRRRCAAPHRNSSLRALLPPIPSPVRSSRFTHNRAPPGSSGPRSSGVGSVASRARGS